MHFGRRHVCKIVFLRDPDGREYHGSISSLSYSSHTRSAERCEAVHCRGPNYLFLKQYDCTIARWDIVLMTAIPVKKISSSSLIHDKQLKLDDTFRKGRHVGYLTCCPQNGMKVDVNIGSRVSVLHTPESVPHR